MRLLIGMAVACLALAGGLLILIDDNIYDTIDLPLLSAEEGREKEWSRSYYPFRYGPLQAEQEIPIKVEYEQFMEKDWDFYEIIPPYIFEITPINKWAFVFEGKPFEGWGIRVNGGYRFYRYEDQILKAHIPFQESLSFANLTAGYLLRDGKRHRVELVDYQLDVESKTYKLLFRLETFIPFLPNEASKVYTSAQGEFVVHVYKDAIDYQPGKNEYLITVYNRSTKELEKKILQTGRVSGHFVEVFLDNYQNFEIPADNSE